MPRASGSDKAPRGHQGFRHRRRPAPRHSSLRFRLSVTVRSPRHIVDKNTKKVEKRKPSQKNTPIVKARGCHGFGLPITDRLGFGAGSRVLGDGPHVLPSAPASRQAFGFFGLVCLRALFVCLLSVCLFTSVWFISVWFIDVPRRRDWDLSR